MISRTIYILTLFALCFTNPQLKETQEQLTVGGKEDSSEKDPVNQLPPSDSKAPTLATVASNARSSPPPNSEVPIGKMDNIDAPKSVIEISNETPSSHNIGSKDSANESNISRASPDIVTHPNSISNASAKTSDDQNASASNIEAGKPEAPTIVDKPPEEKLDMEKDNTSETEKIDDKQHRSTQLPEKIPIGNEIDKNPNPAIVDKPPKETFDREKDHTSETEKINDIQHSSQLPEKISIGNEIDKNPNPTIVDKPPKETLDREKDNTSETQKIDDTQKHSSHVPENDPIDSEIDNIPNPAPVDKPPKEMPDREKDHSSEPEQIDPNDNDYEKSDGGIIYTGTMVDDKNSHFFAYFLSLMVMSILFYLLFHNKQRIIALIIEGRNHSSRKGRGRAKYHKLDNNLGEVMTSTKDQSSFDRIY